MDKIIKFINPGSKESSCDKCGCSCRYIPYITELSIDSYNHNFIMELSY